MLDVKGDTFNEAGKIGLWTKADASSSFDDLAVLAPAEDTESAKEAGAEHRMVGPPLTCPLLTSASYPLPALRTPRLADAAKDVAALAAAGFGNTIQVRFDLHSESGGENCSLPWLVLKDALYLHQQPLPVVAPLFMTMKYLRYRGTIPQSRNALVFRFIIHLFDAFKDFENRPTTPDSTNAMLLPEWKTNRRSPEPMHKSILSR